MTKALVLAESWHSYIGFMRQYGFNRNELRYVISYEDVCGYWIDKPVIMLERYEHNKNYTLQLMRYIGHRFDNIGFLSEGERWNEDTEF